MNTEIPNSNVQYLRGRYVGFGDSFVGLCEVCCFFFPSAVKLIGLQTGCQFF